MILYRELCLEEVNRPLFFYFQRRQNVTKCWRKVNGEWMIKDIAFIDDWTEQEYNELITYLKYIIQIEGVVIGAFLEEQLKGFASVEPQLFGSHTQYMDLSHIYVSEDMRRKGIGKGLFQKVTDYARIHGARKLYISAHSAVESQAFYPSMGCMEAEEYNLLHVEKEPCDCQLEYRL